MGKINSKLYSMPSNTVDLNSLENTIAVLEWEADGASHNRPVNQGGLVVSSARGSTRAQLFLAYNGRLFVRGYYDNAWVGWIEK